MRAKKRKFLPILKTDHTYFGLHIISSLLLLLFFQVRTAALRLIVRSWLDVPTFATNVSTRVTTREHPAAEGGTVGEKCLVILPKCRFTRYIKDLLHAVKLRHGTDGFTSPPKEGVLRIFFALKIRRLRPGVNPRTWVPKASTLPLDHRSRLMWVIRLWMGDTPFTEKL